MCGSSSRTAASRGLIAKQNGAEIELRAGATILATGGFSANPELVKKYIGAHADRCKLRGSKQDTGDGLRMALAVGAKAVNLKYFYGHLISRKALIDDRFWPYPRLDSFVDEGILIDRTGNRFVDEGRGDVAVANELARTNDVTGAALIFDFATWDAAKDDPFSKSVKTPAPNPWLMDNEGEIFHHETIEGLAQKDRGGRQRVWPKLWRLYNRALSLTMRVRWPCRERESQSSWSLPITL